MEVSRDLDREKGYGNWAPPPLKDKNYGTHSGYSLYSAPNGVWASRFPPGQYLYPPLEVPKVSPPLIEAVPLNPLLLQVEEELDDELRAYGLDPRVNRLTQTQLNQAKVKVKTRRRNLPNVSS